MLDHYSKDQPNFDVYIIKQMIHKLIESLSSEDLNKLFQIEKIDPREIPFMFNQGEFEKLRKKNFIKYKVTLNI